MPIGNCRLCGKNESLRQSHIIPKFVFRWMKETSGTGYLRFGQNPNKRIQDGPKPFWLCDSCESIFSDYESDFASKVFLPFCNKELDQVTYEPWLLKFAVSVSWRVALFNMDEGGAEHWSEPQRASLSKAMSKWKDFLLNRAPHPGVFEQHLLPLDELADFTGRGVPPNINRYFLRGIEMDLVTAGPSDCFVYTKIPRFVLLGFISMRRPRNWVGTKVKLKLGEICPRAYDLPGGFGEYLVERCNRMEGLKRKISRTQWDRIQATLHSNPERAANSDAFLALQKDVELFGKKKVFQLPGYEGTE